MQQYEALRILKDWDKKGRYVFTRHDFTKLFSNDSSKTIEQSLRRLVRNSLLQRACKGVYVFRDALSYDGYTIEHVVKALRRGHLNYISLESMLSEYGVISQIPIDRMTIMTTGRSGVYKTIFGVIEFTHTKRSVSNIINNTQIVKERPLRLASKATALRDLKRVGRNIEMINIEDLKT